MRKRITKRVVDAAAPQHREYRILDTEIPGFGVRIRPSGTRTYFIQHRRHARLVRYAIGRHPDLTAYQAREEARRLRAIIVSGGDPFDDRQAQRRVMTVGELCDLYLAEGCDTKKPSTLSTDRGRIKRHIKPLLGRIRITDLSKADIQRFQRDVANGVTSVDIKTKARGRAIVKGGKGTASRTVGLLGGIMTFAAERSFLENNPVRGVKRHKDRKSERFLSEKEMVRLGAVLSEIEGSGADIIRILILTGCRRSEINNLLWEEVDFDHSVLRLRESKTGEKVVPLGPPALQILSGRQSQDNSAFVFPAVRGSGVYGNLRRIWEAARQRAQLENVRLHDLRHTYASVAVAGGASLPVIGAILGHQAATTTQRYAHLSDDPLRRVANHTSEKIADALNRGAS